MATRRLLLIGILLLLANSALAQSIWKEPKNPSWKNATGAEQYMRLLWKAVQAKDWLAVESHIASNFVYADGSGTMDKQQYVEYLRRLTLVEHSVSEANVTASGLDSIVTYVLTLKSETGDSQSVRILSVWQQQKSGWVLIALSKSKIIGSDK